MAIVLEDSDGQNVAEGANLVFTLPGGAPSVGDVLVVHSWTGNDVNRKWQVPTGWTEGYSEFIEQVFQFNIQIMWKVAEAGDTDTFTFLPTDAFVSGSASLSRWSGAANPAVTAPVYATGYNQGPNSGIWTCPAVTLPAADYAAIWIASDERVVTTMTPPAATTQIGSTLDQLACSYSIEGSGGTGTKDWTYTPTWHSGGGFTMALAPDAAPPVGGSVVPLLKHGRAGYSGALGVH